jgi:hypothetical protein
MALFALVQPAVGFDDCVLTSLFPSNQLGLQGVQAIARCIGTAPRRGRRVTPRRSAEQLTIGRGDRSMPVGISSVCSRSLGVPVRSSRALPCSGACDTGARTVDDVMQRGNFAVLCLALRSDSVLQCHRAPVRRGDFGGLFGRMFGRTCARFHLGIIWSHSPVERGERRAEADAVPRHVVTARQQQPWPGDIADVRVSTCASISAEFSTSIQPRWASSCRAQRWPRCRPRCRVTGSTTSGACNEPAVGATCDDQIRDAKRCSCWGAAAEPGHRHLAHCQRIHRATPSVSCDLVPSAEELLMTAAAFLATGTVTARDHPRATTHRAPNG